MTRPTLTSESEAQVRELVQRGDAAAAATLLLEHHGADLFGFLVGVHDDVTVARMTYTSVASRVVAELPEFEWRSSARVWLYSLAHRELDGRRGRTPRPMRDHVLDTEVWHHAGLGVVINAVRRTLTEEERELLILRIDRKLDWHSLAVTHLGESASPRSIEDEAQLLRARVAQLLERIEGLTELHLQRRRPHGT